MKKNERGISLIEVSAGMALLLTMSVMVNSYFLFQKVSSFRQENRSTLANLIQMNVSEIHGRTLAQFPSAGNCVARYYDGRGTFLREETGAVASSSCEAYSDANGEIKVVMRFQAPTTTANFVPSQFLKLPQHIPASLLEVELSAAFRSPQGAKSPPLTLVVMKQ